MNQNDHQDALNTVEETIDSVNDLETLRDKVLPSIMDKLWSIMDSTRSATNKADVDTFIDFHFEMVKLKRKAQQKMMSLAAAKIRNKSQ